MWNKSQTLKYETIAFHPPSTDVSRDFRVCCMFLVCKPLSMPLSTTAIRFGLAWLPGCTIVAQYPVLIYLLSSSWSCITRDGKISSQNSPVSRLNIQISTAYCRLILNVVLYQSTDMAAFIPVFQHTLHKMATHQLAQLSSFSQIRT